MALRNALSEAATKINKDVTKAKIAVIVIASPPYTEEANQQIDKIVSDQRAIWNKPDLQVDIISYDPNDEWLERMIPSTETRMGHVLSMHNYRLLPAEMFSGQRPRLVFFASFCRKGAFEIH